MDNNSITTTLSERLAVKGDVFLAAALAADIGHRAPFFAKAAKVCATDSLSTLGAPRMRRHLRAAVEFCCLATSLR